MYDWLQEALDGHSHVVTANRRLARELSRVYGRQQMKMGRNAWLTPAIDVLADWAGGLIDNADNPLNLPTRIDTYSSTTIWERCLRNHLPDDALNVPGIVRQARQGWQLLCDWQIPLSEVSAAAISDDEQLFARAANDYAKELDAKCWIDDPGLNAQLIELIRDNAVILPDSICVTGFDRIVPSLSALLQELEKAGCPVTIIGSNDDAHPVGSAVFEDAAQELRSAGAWARDILQSEPDARIGVVGLSLENNADSTWRLVMEGLAPGWQRGARQYRNAADVSYGRKLISYPAINVALLLLKWLAAGISSRELGIVLRSKAVGDGCVSARSALDFVLRELPDRTWSVAEFVHILGQRADGDDVKCLLLALSEVARLTDSLPATARPSVWAARFDSMLTTMHWPGDQVLDSEEFQLASRWRKLLNELAGLDQVVANLNHGQAVNKLSSLASEVVYQSEAAPDSVHILGVLEAAGHEFDALWVSGLDATQWPPSGRPAAFLARSLQRKHKMPDSTPADTLQFARRILQRLIGSSGQVVLSWSKTNADAELLVSPLLDEIETVRAECATDTGWHANDYVSTRSTAIVEADPVPAVSEEERVRGGAYTIDQQAREPLAAFVRGRLGVQYPARVSVGLSARQRGIIVHDALRNLFTRRPSRSDIAAWSDEERSALIGSAIDGALAGLFSNAGATLRQMLLIERRRLRELLQNFVSLERERSEFSIHEVETDIEYRRGDVHLKLRADRIDQMPDKQFVVIDYKTGAEKSFMNRDNEPSDLQLVVYADALAGNVGGLSLINIDSRLISYKGEGASIEWARGDAEDWIERLAAWRKSVQDTVDDFASGDVRVDVLAPQSQTRFLQILGRVEELKRAN